MRFIVLLCFVGMSFGFHAHAGDAPSPGQNGIPTSASPKEKRSAAIQEEGARLSRHFNHPAWEMEMGGEGRLESWRPLELETVRTFEMEALKERGFIDLHNLFEIRKNLHLSYLIQERKRAPGFEKVFENRLLLLSLEAKLHAVSYEFEKAFLHLAFLAPTDKARLLEKQAESLMEKWFERFHGSLKWRIWQEQLDEVDRVAARFLATISKLPRLTDEEARTDLHSRSKRALPTFHAQEKQ